MAKNRFKLLIVEDDSNIRTFLRTMLEAEDYQVLCAADCRTGISMFTSHCPDLILLDGGAGHGGGMQCPGTGDGQGGACQTLLGGEADGGGVLALRLPGGQALPLGKSREGDAPGVDAEFLPEEGLVEDESAAGHHPGQLSLAAQGGQAGPHTLELGKDQGEAGGKFSGDGDADGIVGPDACGDLDIHASEKLQTAHQHLLTADDGTVALAVVIFELLQLL